MPFVATLWVSSGIGQIFSDASQLPEIVMLVVCV